MAAPRSRRLRNQTAPVVHSRQEWAIAIGGSILVVVATVVLIWAMRPGDVNSLTPGKGGIIHRQTKVALWLVLTSAAIAIVAWLVLRRDSKVKNPLPALLLGISGVVVVAVAVLGVWHNSLVHDYAVPTTPPTVPPLTTPPSTTPQGTTPATTSPGSTTPGSTTPASTTPATTSPGSTTPATTGATPTTGAAPPTTGG